MDTHLLVGSGGETGRSLAGKLAKEGHKLVITTHRPLPSDSFPSSTIQWDFYFPDKGKAALDKALGPDSLASISLFAHPPFRRETPSSGTQEGILSPFSSLISLLDHLHPRLATGSLLLFFVPSLSRHRADGYLGPRLWVGALQGLIGEWSRNREGILVTGIESLISPGRSTPHMTPEMVERIAGRTSRGRLATADEIADFAAWLILSGSPLFHGQILQTEGGPYF